jgi:hypothetical protein
MGTFEIGSIHAIDINTTGIQSISNTTTLAATARTQLGYDAGNTALYTGLIAGVADSATTPLAGSSEVTYGISRPNNTRYYPRIHL